MIHLPETLAAWGSPDFEDRFKQEVRQLDARHLPLQQGLAYSSVVSDSDFSARVISASEEVSILRVRAGILYSGIIAGCSCADDPTPVGEQTEYCEVLFEINRKNAEATVKLLPTA